MTPHRDGHLWTAGFHKGTRGAQDKQLRNLYIVSIPSSPFTMVVSRDLMDLYLEVGSRAVRCIGLH